MKIFILLMTGLCYALAGAYAQTATYDNKPMPASSGRLVPEGPDVYGVFDAKTPCREFSVSYKVPVRPECFKVKWRLVLFRDSISKDPAGFRLQGLGKTWEGKWRILKGAAGRPQATVYQLDLGAENGQLFLFKGDEHVLFFLDPQRHFLKGNADFSYTLNRVEN
ncbi:hypothetical protein [Chitinophaga sp. XS-30]|uniref:hypothetical protein n=1 Tax=Chitinophaga sp. XS-30 TaxID=2604421 RepID=UPI0011DD1404|nr:hypothetical protein [Chitinophaga sp. XS-30]QEH42944.1 hypothetical protein FW415_19540 [Chitinophaga sp. XS-30]